MGVPLSVMRGQRRPGKKWTDLDRLLVLAVQAYEDDCCPGCGTPRTYGMDDDAAGHYHSQTDTCHACAVKDRAAEDEKKQPGQYRYVVPDASLMHAMTRPIHVNPIPLMRPAHEN